MTQLQLLTDTSKWLINIAFFTGLLFPVVTRAYWPWERSWWGRNIVALELCISLTLLGSVLRIDLGINSFSLLLGWTGMAGLSSVVVVVIWRSIMIYHDQRQGAIRERQVIMNARRIREDDVNSAPEIRSKISTEIEPGDNVPDTGGK